MTNNSYYASTAYRSNAIPDQLKAPQQSFWRRFGKVKLAWGHTEQVFYINTEPKHLREEEQGRKADLTAGRKSELDSSQFHYRYDHQVYRFAKAGFFTRALAMLRVLGFLGTCGFSVTVSLVMLFDISTTDLPIKIWFYNTLPIIGGFIGIPLLMWLIPYVIMRWLPVNWWLRPAKSSAWELNRQTGLVTITNKQFSAPFYEFDACLSIAPDRSGFATYTLHLVHRYSPHSFSTNGYIPITYDQLLCFVVWDFFQNYMDISKPLPDIPELERYRHLDPVTAAYDQQTGRNPRYWLDMDEPTWQQVKTNLTNQIMHLNTLARNDMMVHHLTIKTDLKS